MDTELMSKYLAVLTDLNYTTTGQIQGLKVTLQTLISTLALDAELPPFLNELSNGIEIKANNYSIALSEQDERIAKSFTDTISQMQEHIKNLNTYILTGTIE